MCRAKSSSIQRERLMACYRERGGTAGDVADLALRCINEDPDQRPTAKVVLARLQVLQDSAWVPSRAAEPVDGISDPADVHKADAAMTSLQVSCQPLASPFAQSGWDAAADTTSEPSATPSTSSAQSGVAQFPCRGPSMQTAKRRLSLSCVHNVSQISPFHADMPSHEPAAVAWAAACSLAVVKVTEQLFSWPAVCVSTDRDCFETRSRMRVELQLCSIIPLLSP